MWRHPQNVAIIAVAAALTGAEIPTSNGLFCLAFSTIAPLARRPPRRMHNFLGNGPRSSSPFRKRSGIALNGSSSSSTGKKAKPPPLPETDDPFLLLGLDPRNPTTDAKEIKRAYRKRAMQYHPDVIVGSESTDGERDRASKDFARINAAYEMLTGGGKGSVGAGSGGGGAKTASGGYSYQPPHRRTSGFSSTPPYGKSTNWEDFMPDYKEEDAKYDADGDSFGAIFSDLLTGAAGYAAGAAGSRGSGGIVGDFIDFLERNVEGFESGYDDDMSLSQLILNGSFDEVAGEMDETDVLVTSLETKLSTVANELIQMQADLNAASKFSEKLDLEEGVAELKAREKVVTGYLKKAKKRLIRLRERYKELMVEGRGGRGYGGSSQGGNANASGGSHSGRSSSVSGSYRSPPPSSPSPTSSTPSSSPSSSSSSNNWRNEGFSSSYGKRSSASRRRSSRGRGSATEPASSSPPPAPATSSSNSWRNESFSGPYGRRSSSRPRGRGLRNDGGPSTSSRVKEQRNQRQEQQRNENVYSSSSSSNSSTTTSRSSIPAPQQLEPWVPPHRRTQSSTERAVQDKKRIRELQVDDDFERLKKEMGM